MLRKFSLSGFKVKIEDLSSAKYETQKFTL